MANSVKLWETFDEILAHRARWRQSHYISGKYRAARHWSECGTTQCIAGTRCLMDGLLPVRNSFDDSGDIDNSFDDSGDIDGYRFVDPEDGHLVCADAYAARVFELDSCEMRFLFYYYTDDLTEFKERISDIIDGKYRAATNAA